MAQCKKCSAEIYFLRTKKGLVTPVNAESMAKEEIDFAKVGGHDVSFDHTRHISHFATCPAASSFRKKVVK